MTALTRIVATQLLKNIQSSSGMTITVHAVTETENWKRPAVGYQGVQAEFARVVEGNLSKLPANTVKVSMRYGIEP